MSTSAGGCGISAIASNRAKFLNGRRYWRIPVMEGEFLVQEAFGVQKAIGGGNFLIWPGPGGRPRVRRKRRWTSRARIPSRVVLPFPGGIVRAGSKVGAKHYKNMIASTNDPYCPTLRGRIGVASQLPEDVNSVLEIVVDGLDRPAIAEALRVGDSGCLSPWSGRNRRRELWREARKAPLPAAELVS